MSDNKSALEAPKNLFDTPEKKQSAILDFQGLKANPGWLLLNLILDENIKFIERQILETTGLNKEDEFELKTKRKLFIFLKGLPDQQIKELSNNQDDNPNPDPFD